jgi:hypothetical protein
VCSSDLPKTPKPQLIKHEIKVDEVNGEMRRNDRGQNKMVLEKPYLKILR